MNETNQICSPTTVDRSRKYTVNGGQCERCGFFKTWEFRVQNAKTGKMMPGHVTEDGFKVGDGNCPYWAGIAKGNAERSVKKGTTGGSLGVKPPLDQDRSSIILAAKPVENAGLQDSGEISVQKAGTQLIITAGQIALSLDKKQAIKLARDMLASLVE
nr:hypothetical protein [Candidatus Sigynarchaeota archaeon]